MKNQVFPSGSWKKNDPAVGFAPKFRAECNGRELHSSHGDPFRKKSKIRPRSKKNVVIAKLFAPKFCAECTGRELHSSHGDPFRELFDFRANLKSATSGAGSSSSATLPTKCELKIKSAPSERIKKKKTTQLWRWNRLQRHMLRFFLIHVGRGRPFGPSAQVGPPTPRIKKNKSRFF